MTNEHAGIPVETRTCRCDASVKFSVIDKPPAAIENIVQISHHTGALLTASLDQTIVLTPVDRLWRTRYSAKAYTPVFHGALAIRNSGMTTRAQAIKFAMGASGYVGSMEKLAQRDMATALKTRQSQRVRTDTNEDVESAVILFAELARMHRILSGNVLFRKLKWNRRLWAHERDVGESDTYSCSPKGSCRCDDRNPL